MRVYYDFQILASQKYGGISRYFYELYTRMKPLGVDANVSCIRSVNYYFRDVVKMHDPSEHCRIYNGLYSRAASRINKLRALYEMRNYDILHPTYYSRYMLGRFKGKTVLTVYDMIHEKYNGDEPTIRVKRETINAADRIIAISESTKRDLLELYPNIKPERISVIHLGSSMQPLESRPANPFGKRYVLFVGGRWWYKNFARFVEALRPVLEHQKDLHVFCAGGGEFKAQDFNCIGSLTERFHQVNLDDDTLRQAYANAECFVFPSEYEGFGLPILESFACNCPLVCSSSSSFPEVAGDAAEYFDPLNTEEMSAKISRVLDDEGLREKLRTRGRERLKLFSWDKAARKTLECYTQTMEQ